jgi:S1-C subfamily serine protease
MILGAERGFAGIGFAVPANAAKRWVPEIVARGRAAHPWLGLAGVRLSPSLARGLQLPVQHGILVQRVAPDSPAAAAGVRGGTQRVRVGNSILLAGGDVLLAVDGKALRALDDLDLYLEREKRPGDTVALEVLRDGTRQTVPVRVGEAPAE